MSESILKALMQLFAIIAHVDEKGVSEDARRILQEYLQLHLNHEQVLDYLKLFDNSIAVHHRDITKKDGTKIRKRTSANSVKILMICRQINEELQQKQKVLVMLLLLEFINQNDSISDQEYDFVLTVADIFNISSQEYSNMKSFVLEGFASVPDLSKVMIIDNSRLWENSDIKHIHDPGFMGDVCVLKIDSTNMYAFRYSGEIDIFLNGHIIYPGRINILDQGASIRSKKIKPIYYSDIVSCFLEEFTETKIEFIVRNVEFRFPNSDNGIHKFSLQEESGQLVGIMGGSGVGKSTLLNVLNGNQKPNSGTITINGYDIYTEKNKLNGIIGFIPQDDLLIEELTVYQNLYYNAKLCFKEYSEKQIVEAVDKTLLDLDLYEIKDLKVGGPLNKFISGGQRKRLNIALELIREPLVMFVDEPTSGLSSMDSDIVMDLLKELALKGKLIMVNIHQPSSDIYKLFDKLIIMDKGGYPIFKGNPVDAVVYFRKMSHFVNAEESECTKCGNVSPEHVLQMVEAKEVNEFGRLTRNRKVKPKLWYKRYLEHIEGVVINRPIERIDLPKNKFHIPDMLGQIKIFIIRNVLSKLADKQYMLVNFLEAPILAVILAFLSKYIFVDSEGVSSYIFSENENLPSYLFMSVVVALFLGMTVSAEEIIKDRKILKRESFLNLSRFSYLNSKILILLIISAIQAITFVVVGNFILEIKGMTFSFWLTLFSTAACANMVGLNISSALNSVVTIYILIPFILVPQLLLSGVIVKFDKLHQSLASHYYVPVVGDLMTSRWAYEALAVEQFKNNEFNKTFFYVNKEKSKIGFVKNYLLPELKSKLEQSKKLIGDKENEKKLKKALIIIKNEIKRLDTKKEVDFIDLITIEKYDRKVANKIKSYLKKVENQYSLAYKKQRIKSDHLFDSKIKADGKDAFTMKEQIFHNKAMEDVVLNKNEIKKIVETPTRFIQKTEPVYMEPESNYGRAHLYAATKKISGINIDTLIFNNLVIWLMSLVLYLTLWHNTARKIINFFGNISFSKSNKTKK